VEAGTAAPEDRFGDLCVSFTAGDNRLDENDASQIAALLSYLRQVQRAFHVAVLVVHHARKDANATRPGQALRSSSELHGWGDSNLYMRRAAAPN
jgi:hypothetical protein